LEYEFDAPLHFQDLAEVNVVSGAKFVPDEEEYIAGFPIYDDLIPPEPIAVEKRDMCDPATWMKDLNIHVMKMYQNMMRQLNLTFNLPH
jgi:hypothetical protein